MKILFLHEVGYLEKPIYEMHEFPEHLATMGHEVGFVDLPEQGAQGSQDVFGLSVTGRVIRNATVTLFSQPFRLPGIAGRMIAVFEFSRFFRRVLDQFEPDIIVSFAVPTSGWQALQISVRRQIPFVFRALDVSHKIRKTIFSPLVRIAERYIYRRANWVSANNPALLSYCLALGGQSSSASVDLPPLDLSHFRVNRSLSKGLRNRLGIPSERPVVLYMGSFFYFSGLDDVIDGMAQLTSKPHLVLVGGGEQDARLRAMVRRLDLTQNVSFCGFVHFEDLPEYLSLADVAINPMKPGTVSNLALPNKVLQYMASSLPIVSTRLTGLAELFSSERGLKLVECSSDVLPAALELISHGRLEELGRDNQKAVLDKFSPGRAVKAFEDLLVGLGTRR